MNRVQLGHRVTSIIEKLNATRLALLEARKREAALVETIDQERIQLGYLEGELASLHEELQQALDDEAYDDSYDDDDGGNDDY